MHSCLSELPHYQQAAVATGCTVFPAIVSSSSYIARRSARLTLPEANPTLPITAALAITFPFNVAFGILDLL